MKRHALSEQRYNQVLVIWKFLSRTKQTAGFLAHGLRQCRLPNFSVAAFPHDIVIPHTVTGSHRPHTCFPFTLWPSTIGLQRHRLPHVIQLRTHYKIDTIACQRTKQHKIIHFGNNYSVFQSNHDADMVIQTSFQTNCMDL